MLRVLAVVVAFLGVVVANEISHMVVGNDNLIKTSETNFALTALSLGTIEKWKTVSVNGLHVNIVTETCRVLKRNRNSLRDSEAKLIDETRTRLESIHRSGSKTSSSNATNCHSRYQLAEGGSVITDCNLRESLTSSNGLSVSEQDDKHYSVSKHGLPKRLARLFVLDDVIGYVYLDGKVLMNPVGCLIPKQLELVENLRSEVRRVSESVLKNIEENIADEMETVTSDLNKRTNITDQNKNSNIEDFTKVLNLGLDDLLSSF